MKIAIYHNLPSGGAKRTLFEIASRLVDRHQIDVYTLSCANHQFADLRPLVGKHRVYDYRPGHSFSSPFGRINQAVRLMDLVRLNVISRKVAREIEQADYDIVFVQPCQFENSPSLLSNLNDVPKVFYCQEPLRLLYESMPQRPYDQPEIRRRQILNRFDPLPILYRSALKRVDRRNIRRADLILVNSEFSRQNVNQIYRVDTRVSYLGVNADFFRPINVEKQNVVLSVGSLTPLKGFDFLIRAISEIPSKNRPVLRIASNFQNPPERSYLQMLSDNMDVRLELVGNVTDELLVELYNRAMITVYAPIREPFGLVPLESMACCTPVISVNEGGVKETIIDGKSGYLVERDIKLFAAAIEYLCSDTKRLSEFGHYGREYILQNWTWDRAIAKLETSLLDINGI